MRICTSERVTNVDIDEVCDIAKLHLEECNVELGLIITGAGGGYHKRRDIMERLAERGGQSKHKQKTGDSVAPV